MITIEYERQVARARILELSRECQALREALRAVVELADRPADGKWDFATIQRLNEARQLASQLAGLPSLQV